MPPSINSFLSNTTEKVNLTKDIQKLLIASFVSLVLIFSCIPILGYVMSLSKVGILLTSVISLIGVFLIFTIYSATACAYLKNYMIVIKPLRGKTIVASVNCVYKVKSFQLGFISITKLKYSVDGAKGSKFLFGRSAKLQKLKTNIDECIEASKLGRSK